VTDCVINNAQLSCVDSNILTDVAVNTVVMSGKEVADMILATFGWLVWILVYAFMNVRSGRGVE